jgi:hypothetical protein
MTRIAITAIAALLAGACHAQDTRTPAESRPSEKVEALKEQLDVLRAKLREDYAKIVAEEKPDQDAAIQNLSTEFKDASGKIATSLLAIAEAAPKDAAALTAVRHALETRLDPRQIGTALSVLDEHALGERIAEVLPRLSGHGAKGIDALLKKVLEQNPARAVKGNACFQLAMRTRDEAARELLLERLVKEFSDVPQTFGKETLGDVAERRLFAMRNLRVGKTAPDIEGKDMDGVAFKLSDYRGKVVLLDFWGFW